mmetsp:Transcript_14779/g.30071  ORF Transcript_14779/g.30071 Transcript_14779/m.30071 type:complete len:81 (+) Transcript_14779:1212-1454(+)
MPFVSGLRLRSIQRISEGRASVYIRWYIIDFYFHGPHGYVWMKQMIRSSHFARKIKKGRAGPYATLRSDFLLSRTVSRRP